MPKGTSGVNRKRGASKMSPQDAWQLQRDEKYLKDTAGAYPYVKPDMTRDQIRDAIVERVKETGRGISAGNTYIYPEDIDGRFSAPKNNRFIGLVDAINATDLRELPPPPRINGRDRDGPVYRQLEQHVQDITSGYTTRELREFVGSEMGRRIYRGGRPEYITDITLSLADRFIDRGNFGHLKRHRLEEPSSELRNAAGLIKQHFDVRETISRRVAAIRGKYKQS